MPRKYEKVQDLLPVVKDMAEAGYKYRQIAGKLGLGGSVRRNTYGYRRVHIWLERNGIPLKLPREKKRSLQSCSSTVTRAFSILPKRTIS